MKGEKMLAKVGFCVGMIAARVLVLKVGWWVCELEGWCGMSLPWGVALFFAIITIRYSSTHNLFVVNQPALPCPEFDPDKAIHC